VTPAPPLPPYVPPTGDDPLDAVEEALVQMWIDILVDRIREQGGLVEQTNASHGGKTGEARRRERETRANGYEQITTVTNHARRGARAVPTASTEHLG